MGATWFVSYCYYRNINPMHRNWDLVSTAASRSSVYNGSTSEHKQWLIQIMSMNSNSLDTNTIGLSGNEVKLMAKEILNKCYNYNC